MVLQSSVVSCCCAVQGLNEREGAHHAFTTSLMVFEGLAEGWLSWASYCDSVYESSKDRTWLQHAVCCYLQVREGGELASCQGGAATRRGCQHPGDSVCVHHASAAPVSLGAAVSSQPLRLLRDPHEEFAVLLARQMGRCSVAGLL